jgi:glycosyltransferase involved in cell wall biosynthesis
MHYKKRIFIAHPYRHHVYHLVYGAFLTGVNMQAILPHYVKNTQRRSLRWLKASLLQKLSGCWDERIDSVVVSPFPLQTLRLLMPLIGEKWYLKIFDYWIMQRLKNDPGPKGVFIAMQDYLPKSTLFAKSLGWMVVSDQILNQSSAASKRIANSLPEPLGERPSAGPEHADQQTNELILSIADVVFVPSQYCLEAIPPIALDKCKIIPYGVDIRRFTPVSNLPKSGAVKIVARANSQRKGLTLLLGAIVRLLDRDGGWDGPPLEIHILGDIDTPLAGYYSEWKIKYDEICVRNNIVISAGNVAYSEVPELLASAHIFCMPSLSEGMSLAIVEAMASGIPVICTPYCGVDMVIDGISGYVHHANVDDLASTLVRAIAQRDSWFDMGHRARDAALSLDWARYSASISGALHSLVFDCSEVKN